MKRTLLFFIAAITLLAFPKINFGQTPNLGTAGNFALFTAAGAFNCTGASVVTGDVGTAEGAFNAFPPGTLIGVKHVLDPISTQASVDVKVAYSDLFARTCGAVIGTTLGNGQVLSPNVYCLGAASTLNGDLILDGEGDPNALFIIKIDGALSTNANSNVILINGASSCNVYWQINGALGQGAGFGINSTFRGIIVANGAISFSSGAKLYGSALTQAGAISLSDNLITAGEAASASTITADGPTTICEGESVILSGNNGGVWSTGATTPTITVSTSGDYFVTNTSVCGEAISNHIVVEVNPLPTAAVGNNASICIPNSVTLGAAAVPGSTYSWTPAIGLSSATIANPVASPVVTTIYTLTETITATGCQSTNSVTVTVDPAPVASVITAGGATTFCANENVVLSGNNGGVWSNGATTPSITVSTTGDYFVTNTTACGSVSSNHISVTVNPSPEAVAGANRAICLNESTQIGAPAVSGNTYSWTSDPAEFTDATANPTVTPLVTTTYTLVETNTATGCQATNSVTVTIDLLPPTASVIAADGPTILCVGESVTLSGNVGGTWSNGATTPSITVTTAGDYFVTNTSGCGADVTSNHLTVTVNPLPSAVAGADRSICPGVSTQLGTTAVTGSTYSWTSSPAGFASTSANPTVTPMVTTTYTVVETITATGCTNTHSVVVTVYPLPAAIAGADRDICINTTTQIGGANVSGSTYSWTSVPAGFTSSIANPSVKPLITTTYTVVETNTTTGCTNSNSVVVTVSPVPLAIAGADRAICLNTATQIGFPPIPGSTYKWTSVPAGFTSAQSNPTVSPLITTTYRVLETNAAGCSNANTVVVTVNPIPEAVAGADRVICSGTSTTLGAAAVTGSTYSWSSVPAGFTSTEANPTVTPMVSTTYTVVETITATGCTKSNSVVVTVNPTPEAIAGFSRTICVGTSTTLGAAAVSGSTYRWSSVPTGFSSTVANPTVSPLVTTTYIVVETNTADGCVNSNSVLVTVTSLPEANAGADRTICLNESTQIGATAIAGNTYSWTSVPEGFTSTEANPVVSPLVTTTYTVVETKTGSECAGTATNSVVVSVSPVPAAIAGADRVMCLNAGTQIGAAAVAGSTYSWSSVPAGFASTTANPTVNPLVTTTYAVVETNTATGCVNSNSVVVTVNPIPEAIAGADRTICEDVNTQIGAAAVTGSTYSWSSVPAGFTSSVANPTVSPIVTTTYTVIETSDAGCINSNSVVVTVIPAPAAIAGADRDICLNANTQIGSPAVAVNTYSWTSVPAGFTSTVANPTVSPLVTTTYTLVETNDANGCQQSNSVTVTISTGTVIVAQPADQLACVGNSVSFTVTATGTDLTYQWRRGTVNLTDGGTISGATTATLTINPVKMSDAATDYNVVISGACSSTETSENVSLEVESAPTISTSACIGSTVSFSANATGSALTYQWRKGNVDLTDGGNISGATSPTLTINPVSASDASPNYNVVITGTCSPDATSLNIGLVVNAGFSITAEPTNQEACVGNAAVFTVGTTGTGLTYQWRKGTVNLTNGGNISGATSPTLTINPVSAADVASDYNVVVTGPCSPMATSNAAALSLCVPNSNASLENGDTKNAVTIYPNPFTASIDIRVNDASKIDNYKLKIYNILGEEVLNTLITKDVTTLKTSNLTSGVYLFEVSSNNKTIQSGKLISKQ
jgi:hypothetical protein